MSAGSAELDGADEAARPGVIVAPALGLAAGIALGHHLGHAAVGPWLAAAATLCVMALLTRRWPRITLALLTLAAAGLGGGRIVLHEHRRPVDDVAALAAGGPVVVTVSGVASASSRVLPRDPGPLARFASRPPALGFPARLDTLVDGRGRPRVLRGDVFIVVHNAATPVRAGQRVQVTGVLRDAAAPGNPGPNAWRTTRGGRDAVLFVDDAAGLRVRSGGGSAWWRIRAMLRDRARAALAPAGSEPDPLLTAMLLGARDAGYPALRGGFQRVGLAHLLAISGLHLGVVAGVLMRLLDATGAPRPRRSWIVVVLVLVYLVVVEVRLPLLRAGVMTIAICLGRVANRRLDIGGVVAACGAGLLLWRPEQIFTAGFQLSFGVVLGLIRLAGPVRRSWFGPPRPAASTVVTMTRQWLAGAVSVAVTAWLIATPLAMYHFGLLSPLGAPLSIAAVPMAAVLLVAGYARLLLGLVAPPLAVFLDPLLEIVAGGLAVVVRVADALPGSSVHLAPPSAWWVSAALAWVSAWGRRPARRGGRVLGLAAVGLVAWRFTPGILAAPSPPLRLDMLAVGDGSCVVARSGGRVVLFDAGSSRANAGAHDIVPALHRLGVRRLDAVAVSHPNLDHYSALLEVIETLPPRVVLLTEGFHAEVTANPHGAAAYVRRILRERSIAVRTVAAGARGRLGATTWRWMHPPAGWTTPEVNDASMMILIDAGPRRVLLCGDVERAALRRVREAYPFLTADVVELPHHGSHRAAAASFVRSLRPRLLLQSTGPRRLERDPWPDAVPGVPRLVTARDGACCVEIDADGGLRWSGFRDRLIGPGAERTGRRSGDPAHAPAASRRQ